MSPADLKILTELDSEEAWVLTPDWQLCYLEAVHLMRTAQTWAEVYSRRSPAGFLERKVRDLRVVLSLEKMIRMMRLT